MLPRLLPPRASSRERPLLVYDGECGFCTWWVRRWRAQAGTDIEFATFQTMASSLPEVPLEQFRAAVQLVDTDGRVYSAAEAVLRALTRLPGRGGALWAYENVPGLAAATEWCYRRVARRRGAALAITRFVWGRHPEPDTSFVARWIFVRLVALAYLAAFGSLGLQVRGLLGTHGIAPAGDFLQRVAAVFGPQRFLLLPTLCWWNVSDAFLQSLCAGGAALALLLLLDVAPAIVLGLMWIAYLSLAAVGQDFLSFQWDALLLETGFLAIFLAPARLRPRRSAAVAYSGGALWLARFLGFRLTIASGAVKLLSGDSAWRSLTALEYHYETQPLPTWIGWWAHQLPARFQRVSCLAMFAIELGVPFLILMPGRLRQLAFWPLMGLQTLIAATGNYCFFNVLTVALYVLLLEDRSWPRGARSWLGLPEVAPETQEPTALQEKQAPIVPQEIQAPIVAPEARAPTPAARASGGRPRRLRRAVLVGLGCLSALQLLETFGMRFGPVAAALDRAVDGFHIANRYGLFAVMTTERREIIVEGSDDGTTWRAYEFKYKPGNLGRRPAFVAPHQPRLDWQMWFAALSSYESEPWFMAFCGRLLQGEPAVLALLGSNPFPDHPPRYVRALAYRYRFTDRAGRHASGAWWRRELEGPYCPTLSLRSATESQP